MTTTRRTTVIFVVLLLSCTTAMAGGSPDPVIPDDGPAYGVENGTYQRLWSDDTDDANLSLDDFDGKNTTSKAAFVRRLTKSTDIPFEQPPQAVEDWNQGDINDYSHGNRKTSVHPAGASLEDGVYIKDAFVSIFAIQPSTVLHQGRGTTQHIAPDGQVLAISDYRVIVPEDDHEGSHRERWDLLGTKVENVTLSADGRTLDTSRGHKTTLEYSSLSGSPRLTVTAEITMQAREKVWECTDWNITTDDCVGSWDHDVHKHDFSKTVSSSRDVDVNRLTGASGNRVRFEASDRTGAVINPDTAWSKITIEDETRVRSNWWFYSAGTPGWRTMVSETATDSTRSESSVRPLRVHAYPSKVAPYVPTNRTDGEGRKLTIEEAWGASEQPGPSLPSKIDLDPANSYENADSIAVSSESVDDETFREVTVHGIVRGQTRTLTLSKQRNVRETNLTLRVVDSNSSHATVHAIVTENASGDPITTGRVEIGNESTTLNSSGVGVITLTNPPALVRGQYHPTEWWRTTQPHAAAVDVTKTPGDYPEPETIIDLTVVTLLWFVPAGLAVFGLDYLSGGSLLGFREP